MRHIIQKRGPGTAYSFKIKTPRVLAGRIDPTTGAKFGTFIYRSLGGERHLPTARKVRDLRLAEVRAMEADATAGTQTGNRFSLESAKTWADALRAQRHAGGPDEDEPNIRDLIEDMVEDARGLPPSKRLSDAAIMAFQKTALTGTLGLSDAISQYLYDRRPGNTHRYAPLRPNTQRDLEVAVRYLRSFLEERHGHGDGTIFLDDITPKLVNEFRGDYLPSRKSPRSPSGMGVKTVEKHISFLKTLWTWAMDHNHLPSSVNPWVTPTGIRREARDRTAKSDIYTADEVTKMLRAHPRGDRLGDVFRLALITGCRADELAKVRLVDVAEDGASFRVAAAEKGKTVNATRTLTVPAVARPLLTERAARCREGGSEKLFPEWPLRPATGKASALSQAFTRERRKVLGAETDGRLTFHALRHTWRTIAYRAGVPEKVIAELGGWAGGRTSADAYDHGLHLDDLMEKQELVAAKLHREGYLQAF